MRSPFDDLLLLFEKDENPSRLTGETLISQLNPCLSECERLISSITEHH